MNDGYEVLIAFALIVIVCFGCLYFSANGSFKKVSDFLKRKHK